MIIFTFGSTIASTWRCNNLVRELRANDIKAECAREEMALSCSRQNTRHLKQNNYFSVVLNVNLMLCFKKKSP